MPEWLPYWEIASRLGMSASRCWVRIKQSTMQPHPELGPNGRKLWNLEEACVACQRQHANGASFLLRAIRKKHPDAVLAQHYIDENGYSEKRVRNRLKSIAPKWQLNGVKFYTNAQLDELFAPLSSRFTERELNVNLTKKEIQERLSLTKCSVDNYIFRMGIKSVSTRPGADGYDKYANLYNFGEFVAVLEMRMKETEKAKQSNATKAREKYTPSREILREHITLEERVLKLRRLGHSAGKIASLCSMTIPQVWATIQKQKQKEEK